MIDYRTWSNEMRLDIEDFQANNKKYFVSSSFQTHSIPLLHALSKIDSLIKVYFIDTGFHFPETYSFVNHIEKLLKIKVYKVESKTSKLHQQDSNGKFLFCRQPDRCCDINKVKPIEPIASQHDVWISGVRKNQNNNRRTFSKIMVGQNNTLRYHPILEWTNKDVFQYRKLYSLPEHPLEKHGYFSIGCSPCTNPGSSRSDRRWSGSQKEECGLNII